MKENTVSIWFLIGLLLTTYGTIITLSGLYRLIVPPATLPVLGKLHADIWWGALLLVIGLAYVVKFRPSPRRKP